MLFYKYCQLLILLPSKDIYWHIYLANDFVNIPKSTRSRGILEARMSIDIVYATEKYFKSYHNTLDQVAKEQIYIEMIEAKPFVEISEFYVKLISQNSPAYFAINQEQVIGWADISFTTNPRLKHRGHLGMGLSKDYRGQGLGYQLLSKALDHAKTTGLEKVELSVYTSNTAAIKLYKKCGFTEVGVIKKFRKLNEKYFDCLIMETFL